MENNIGYLIWGSLSLGFGVAFILWRVLNNMQANQYTVTSLVTAIAAPFGGFEAVKQMEGKPYQYGLYFIGLTGGIIIYNIWGVIWPAAAQLLSTLIGLIPREKYTVAIREGLLAIEEQRKESKICAPLESWVAKNKFEPDKNIQGALAAIAKQQNAGALCPELEEWRKKNSLVSQRT